MSQSNSRPRRSPSGRRARHALTVAALAAAAPAVTVQAANIAFTGGDRTGNFNDPLNWSTGTVPGSGDLAVFGDVGLSNAGTGGIIDTGAAQSIGTLAFGSAAFTLSTPTTIDNNSITLNVITGMGGLSRYGGGTGGVGATTGTDTVNSALILAKSQQWSIGGNTTSGSVVINGVVSESTKSLLTKIGTGVLELSAANTFSGGYAVYAGTTIADTNTSLGTDLTDNVQVGVTGGTTAVALVTNGVTNFAYNIGVVPNASAAAPVTLGGTVGQTSSTWTGTINVNRDIALTGGTTGTTTFAGTLNTGTGASSNVTKINTGLVVLTGSNTYVGSTNVLGRRPAGEQHGRVRHRHRHGDRLRRGRPRRDRQHLRRRRRRWQHLGRGNRDQRRHAHDRQPNLERRRRVHRQFRQHPPPVTSCSCPA